MPNWCECDLKVSGPGTRVRELVEFAKGENDGDVLPFDFTRFIPYPAEYGELDKVFEAWLMNPDRQPPIPKDGYNSGGYEWCIEHWGTKWNATRFAPGSERESRGKLTVLFYFSTAWSPPCPVIRAASERFPEISFDLRYYEGLACFCGRFTCRGGLVVHDVCRPYRGCRGG